MGVFQQFLTGISLRAVCIHFLNSAITCTYACVGRDSAVRIATRYGLDGPGIESQ